MLSLPKSKKMIVILGPTATGKTAVATQVAHKTAGEIISADSRQVFRGMDLGTGKDLAEYCVNGCDIPYHLIDIAEPGEEYSVFRFQQDFLSAWKTIHYKGAVPILCGGTGFYIESILKQYQLTPVPDNAILRAQLENRTNEELAAMLATMRSLHNTTDTQERNRLVRAIEIETYYKEHPDRLIQFPDINYQVFGITFERDIIRQRITKRLEQRLKHGMLEEVERLLQQGITPSQLDFYGLEYRYVTRYITGELSYDEMFRLLNTAIHQFAKRQMTWFRKMEKAGIEIEWLDSHLTNEAKVEMIVSRYSSKKKAQQ